VDRRPPGHPWPRAAVFDCDGLLVDSTHCWHDAYAELARARGRSLADLDLAALAGASVAEATAQLCRDLACPLDERELRALLHESFAARPPRAMAGSRALVAALAQRVPVGVASNAPLDILHAVLEDLELRGMMEAVVSAEDTAAEKPAPDVYLEACRRLDVCPSDAIAFEDSPLGARAARDAGLFVIAVPSAPGMLIDADLTVARLDDPELLGYLRLAGARASDGRASTPLEAP
jgi:HAD superfamily hydrolase (TIGR01509 family)